MTETTTETLAPSMFAALMKAADSDVLYTLKGVTGEEPTGFAYAATQEYKQQLDEVMEVRAQAKAMVNAIPATIRSMVPAEIIAGLLSSTDAGQLERYATLLDSAIEEGKRSEENKLTGQHADEMTPEEKIAHLTREIDALDESMEERIRRLHAQGLISDEAYEDWLRKQQFAEANPESIEAQHALTAASDRITTELEKTDPTAAAAHSTDAGKRDEAAIARQEAYNRRNAREATVADVAPETAAMEPSRASPAESAAPAMAADDVFARLESEMVARSANNAEGQHVSGAEYGDLSPSSPTGPSAPAQRAFV